MISKMERKKKINGRHPREAKCLSGRPEGKKWRCNSKKKKKKERTTAASDEI